MKTGLDDGPLLPSPQQIEKACRKIDQESRTDVQRINWMEGRKYLKIGIGFDGKRFTSDVELSDRDAVPTSTRAIYVEGKLRLCPECYEKRKSNDLQRQKAEALDWLIAHNAETVYRVDVWSVIWWIGRQRQVTVAAGLPEAINAAREAEKGKP